MESFGNERRVQQGEDWNLDLLLSGSNKEYIPFIVPQAMAHPYFAITVGSTKYEKNYRYVKTWWNEYIGPKFKSTVPIYYGEVTPSAPAAVDLGEHLFPPTAFNYRDYSQANIYDFGEQDELFPELYDYTSGDSPYATVPGSDQVKIGDSAGANKLDIASQAKIYQVDKVNDEVITHYYYRVYSYRGLKLDRSIEVDDLRGKIVEIGYNDGTYEDYEVNYFVSTPDRNPLYKYTLTGDDTIYYCKFNFETNELETIEPGTIALPDRPNTTDPNDPTYGDTNINRNLYYYTVSTDKIDPTLGHKPYYYFYFDYTLNYPIRVDGYECRIHQNFLTKETAEWNSQNYMYQITLVNGQLMEDYLAAQKRVRQNEGYDLSDYPNNIIVDGVVDILQTNAIRYDYFKRRWPDTFQSDIDRDSRLGTIDTLIPIMQPTKLEVYNNIRRLI